MTGVQTNKPLEILVIDDEAPVREVMADMLAYGGENIGLIVNVTTAEDGRVGVDLYTKRLTNQPFGAVITDLNMPNLDGNEVVKRIKELSSKTPVYIVTGYEPNAQYIEKKERIDQLAPDGVIEKPFTMAKVQNTLREITSKICGTGAPLPQQPQS
ncbi:response regulator [Candidatus Woesearchaeota archaeon]|nr:response regulator [Candidatus Woesearchaeota archaeon]